MAFADPPLTDVLAALKGGREILSDASRWTQFAAAVDAAGNSVPAHFPGAVRFCAYGACSNAARGYGFDVENEASGMLLDTVTKLHGYAASVTYINDGRFKTDREPRLAVLHIYDTAIADLEAEIAAMAAIASH